MKFKNMNRLYKVMTFTLVMIYLLSCFQLPMAPVSGIKTSTLLTESVGWGENATGGTNLVVISPELDALRTAAGQGNNLIRFNGSGTIYLDENLYVASNTTLDARNSSIIITGEGGIRAKDASNIIISNFEFRNFTDGHDGVGIGNSSDVWVDHCTFVHDGHPPRESDGGPDGALDITGNSTRVTVSWCKFQNHKKVMLIGGSEEDFPDNITIHHCYFTSTSHRHPLVRNARVHVYNCFYEKWYDYAIGAGKNSKMVIENCIFDARPIISLDWDGDITFKAKRGVFFENDGPLYCDVGGSWFRNGATFEERNVENAVHPSNYYDYGSTLELADGNLENKLKVFAGRQDDADNIPAYVPGTVGENVSEASIEDFFIILGMVAVPVIIVLLIVVAIRRKKRKTSKANRAITSSQ
ncbi:MAG: polysaccharide lyase family 1 protein [Candidatus Hodarchaeota archaeon]